MIQAIITAETATTMTIKLVVEEDDELLLPELDTKRGDSLIGEGRYVGCVGTTEGDIYGSRNGDQVGIVVGSKEGIELGLEVGLEDGLLVGRRVGASEGLEVLSIDGINIVFIYV
jgi:hypothetical protein